MFVDEVTITTRGGKGGNGSVHFKRNAQTARGGPDGGNGGRGGNVYFQGVNDITALREFRYRKSITAENGIDGGRQNLYGRAGQDVTMRIPVGTLVSDVHTHQTWEITNDMTKHLMAAGGKGGRGNNEFKTATDQAPHFAEKGEPGQERKLFLELQLTADIGLIGLPNAGKSSLLTQLTNARPKIGAYPFTTLEPNLGMMQNIIISDIPGLIEGASSGKGLGITFLRHIKKTKLLVHCIACDTQDVIMSYKLIRNELANYDVAVTEKPEILLLTKTDLIEKHVLNDKIKELKQLHKDIFTVSIYEKPSIVSLENYLESFVSNASR